MTRCAPSCALFFSVLLLGLSASATSMLRVDLPELSRSADVIVHGTVRRLESRWSGDGRLIVTDVEIQVTEALKGEAPGTLVITQPGGRVGDIGQRVNGLATFAPAEEVVVFLTRQGSRDFRVAGMAQGKYQVLRSAGTAGKVEALAVPESTADTLLVDAATHAPTASSQQSLPLAQLKTAIRAALAREPGR